MTAAARSGPVPGWRGSDRVGGARFTPFGVIVLAVLAVTVASPPRGTDRQILVLLWAAIATALVVGIAWPSWAVRRVRVRASSPRDAVVGEYVPVEVDLDGVRGACEVRALDPTGAWHRVAGADRGTIEHLADRRGLFHSLRVEVRVRGPVGVFAAHRVHQISLPCAVEVAPRPLAVDWLPAPAPVDGLAALGGSAVLGGDLVRSVRPYAPGDPAHLVHWPTTARMGTLVVRELEPPQPLGQAIVVDLRDLGAETERAAAYGLGAALAVLAQGGELVLCTAEADGPVVERVRAPIDAARRLARAVIGAPGAAPAGWPVVEIGR
jgi:uncharacterized protein (DUF58 family)